MSQQQSLVPAYIEHGLSFPLNPSSEVVEAFLQSLLRLPSEVAQKCMESLSDEQAQHVWEHIGGQYTKGYFGWNVATILPRHRN